MSQFYVHDRGFGYDPIIDAHNVGHGHSLGNKVVSVFAEIDLSENRIDARQNVEPNRDRRGFDVDQISLIRQILSWDA